MKRRNRTEIREAMKKYGSTEKNHYAYIEIITFPKQVHLEIEGPITKEHAVLLAKVARMDGSVDPGAHLLVEELFDLFRLEGERRTMQNAVECTKTVLLQLRRAGGGDVS